MVLQYHMMSKLLNYFSNLYSLLLGIQGISEFIYLQFSHLGNSIRLIKGNIFISKFRLIFNFYFYFLFIILIILILFTVPEIQESLVEATRFPSIQVSQVAASLQTKQFDKQF